VKLGKWGVGHDFPVADRPGYGQNFRAIQVIFVVILFVPGYGPKKSRLFGRVVGADSYARQSFGFLRHILDLVSRIAPDG
jgi:hypothetical protein